MGHTISSGNAQGDEAAVETSFDTKRLGAQQKVSKKKALEVVSTTVNRQEKLTPSVYQRKGYGNLL